MSSFNYSNLRFFQKDGTELMVSSEASLTLTIKNPSHSSEYAQYIFINDEPKNGAASLANSSFFCLRHGTRFPLSTPTVLDVTVGLPDGTIIDTSIGTADYDVISYVSSEGTQYYPVLKYNNLSVSGKESFLTMIGAYDAICTVYPTAIMNINLGFEKVSTGLVETQSIIVMTETDSSVDGVSDIVDVKTYAETHADASTYINNCKLMFFIDCREHKDFRFFTLDGDEIVWSDRAFIDFSNGVNMTGEDSGYRVDIGFVGEDEGVYESTLYICAIGKSDESINVIGTINLTAETEGLDERYKTLFTNFGLPDMTDLEPAFKDTDHNEDFPDYVSINRHAKKIFLSYADIFPYAGSYKGLFNAMKLLGYDDIYFKEWYKEIGESTKDDLGYVTYDISDSFRTGLNTINSTPIEERIHLRKLNWVSMMYRLNEELDSSIDEYGFPEVVTSDNYYTTGNLVKLISLKNCIDKYVSGINCRITDIGGEGVVFERYQVNPIGQYQQVLDYVNTKHIATVVESPVSIMKDSSAYITVSVNTLSGDTEIDSFDGKTLADFCSGYFSSGNVFTDVVDGDIQDDSSVTYFGQTFEMNDNMNTFEIRALGDCDSFRFDSDFIDSSSPTLLVDDNEIIFDPHDLLTKRRNTVFTNLPVIQITEGKVKRYVDNRETFGELAYESFVCNVGKPDFKTRVTITDYTNDSSASYLLDDVLTLIPPRYNDNGATILMLPRFSEQNERKVSQRYMPADATMTMVGVTDKTYGLRFTTSDINGIPTFMITGYESPQMTLGAPNIHYPLTNGTHNGEPYEYYIEITKGRMIFDDTEKNRKVMLNFDYVDGKRIIYVSTLVHSKGFTLNEYRISPSALTDRFQPGQSYRDFINLYHEHPEQAVIFRSVQDVKVYNTGKYEVDSILFDEYNNMFAHKANRTCLVTTSDIDASTYSYDSSSLNDYNLVGVRATSGEVSSITSLCSADDNKCILPYERRRNVQSRDGSLYTISGMNTIDEAGLDNGSTELYIDSSFDFAELSSTSTRFDCVGYNKSGTNDIFLSLIRRSYRDSSAGPLFVDSSIDFRNSLLKLEVAQTPTNVNNGLIAAGNCDVYNNAFVANVIFYDETAGVPLMTYPAIVASTMFYNGNSAMNKDEYRALLSAQFVEGGESSDIDTIISLINLPYVSIYLNPCWNMHCLRVMDSSIYIEEVGGIFMPFTKDAVLNDCYKLSYSPDAMAGLYFGSYSIHVEDSSKGATFTYKSDVEHNDSDEASVNFYFSPSTQDYTKYALELDVDESDPGDGKIVLKDTARNRELSYYIDTSYAIVLRDFDSDNGMKMWNDASSGVISNQYSYNCPITTTKKFVTLAPVLSEAFSGSTPISILTSQEYTAKWRIYKQHDNSKRTLLVECYNKVLSLELPEKGVYDVDLTVYDRHGNKYCKFLDGAIMYK